MWRLLLLRFRKSKCNQTRDRLSAYLDQRLDLQERGEVERHLEACQGCRQELGSLQATVQLLHRVPQVLPARTFAIREARPLPRRSPFQVLRTATAVLAVFLVLIFAFDMTNLFHTGPVSTQEKSGSFYGSEEGRGDAGDQATLDINGETNQEEGEAGWVRPLEYSVLGGVVVLGGVTIAAWRGRRRGIVRDQR